jgi:hypothetical protein
MAIKSINLLPEIFRTDTNRKFLNATIDQLISENNATVRLDSYIGRIDAVTWRAGDTYAAEPNTTRSNYQLETSVIVDSGQGQTDFYSSYQDLLNQISFYGGLVNDHSRLFTNESYNFDGVFDFDKFVNFTQYVWLPNGPPEVTVSANTVDVSLEFNVERSTATQSYQFTEFAQDRNPIISLIKGTRYRFRINQPGFPFWIQTRPGATGSTSPVAESLSRTIYGLDNNGIDVGTIEFNVPASDAQGTVARARLAATVDFATTRSFKEIQSHLTSVLNRTGGIDGVFQSLNGKTLIFINQDNDNDSWQDPGSFDFYNFDADSAAGMPLGFSYGETVPGIKRFGVFRIRTVDVGNGREVVQLDPVQDIAVGEKVYVRAGVSNSNVEFLKNTSGYFEAIAPVTSPLTELYYQDNSESGFFGTIKLVEPGIATLNVETDIVNRINYTSPNGVQFTNGLHIRFDNTATPANYAGNAFIVEGVGTNIRLVPIGNLSVPEQYAAVGRLGTPDYITINRGSRDLNAWSRSNRWFHIQTVEAAAVYREDPDLLDLSGVQRGKRPIIEFASDLYLYEYGQQAKSPVDVLDFTVTDAFNQVEGKSNYLVQLPNGITRDLTPGTRIIFAGDLDPEVRRHIYRVDQIVTTGGVRLHLVSQNTTNLPTYTINSAVITSNLAYNFVPTVAFAPPLPGIGATQALGNVILKDTGISNLSVVYSGINYVADPFIKINSEFATAANIDIIYRPFKQVDYIRVDYAGTGYVNNTPNVTITNPNEYWGRVTNAAVGTTGLTFEIAAAPLLDSVTTTVLSTDGTGNLNATFSNVGLGYFAANANVTISAPNLPNGIPAVVNTVHLFANGAVKTVNLLSNGSGYLTAPTLTFTGANTYLATASNVSTTTGPSTTFWDFVTPGMQVIANGIIGGTVVTAIDNEANLVTINAPAISANLLIDPPLTGLSTVTENDIWIFKANSTNGTFATVSANLINSKLITVDSTSMVDTGMIVNGGDFPVAIADIRIDVVPTRIITTTSHGLIDGDLVYLRSIVGTTELNFSRYYVTRISDTAVELYTSISLNEAAAQDSRNFADYISGGTLTAYTIDYARIQVDKVLSETQFTTTGEISTRAGTKLVFGGVQATAVGRSDGNGVYNIAVTNPGSGYENVPAVLVESSPGNQATATAITNDDIISYIRIIDGGTGYRIGSDVSVEVVSYVDLTTSNVAVYGSTTLYFDNADDLIPVQEGWLVFLETLVEGQSIYTDFAQIPYAETEVTGPNSVEYRSFMDVSRTRANILTVTAVNFDRLELSGPILSLDSDGELIDLPAGAKIHVTAQNKFFTDDGQGSGARVSGDTKNTFVVLNEAVDTGVLTLNNVLGVQTGMLLQTLAGTLIDDIRVTAVDSYINRITLNKTVTIAGRTPVQFSFNSRMTVNLQPAEVDYIDIVDEGSGYTSAPEVIIESLVPVVEKLASSDGTDVLSVDNFTGIRIGSKVTSTYDNNGVGITTGNDVPVVTELFLVQTGSATFENRIRLNKVQPVFSDVLVTFTFAAEAVAQVDLENLAVDYNDETPETYDVDDTVLVNIPANKTQTATNTVAYNQFYFDGTDWLPAQQKSQINQEPLFDAYDTAGFSAGDAGVYPGTKFAGTKIFGYREGIGVQDAVLGFPLVYRNFENVGDIEFENFFQRDTFNYLAGFTEATVAISNFVLRQKTDTEYRIKNIWTPTSEDSKQFQVIQSIYDGTTNYFEIDALPEESKTIPYLKVYIGVKRLEESAYTVTQFGGRYAVIINVDQLILNERVVIKVYSLAQSKIGKYETPINLDYNPLNTNFDYLTLGQVRNHLRTQADNHYGVLGDVLGSNNLRDLDIKAWQGSILQHSGSMAITQLFLTDQNLNAITAIEFAAKEYTKFKNRFLDMSTKIQVDLADIPGTVDRIMASIMLGKNNMSPWYDSDMLSWGNKFKTVTVLPVLNIRQKNYLIPATFDPTKLSTRSVLVYLRDTANKINRQLIRDLEFSFLTDTSSILVSDTVNLTYTSQLVIVDVSNTTECYVPETPTKLGLYPSFVPTKFVDDTYRNPITVIQGHDGSITPAFNDYRDDLLLELELRIYNNIKVTYDNTLFDLYSTVPGAFRKTGYNRNEWNQLLTRNFLGWVGNNKLDYSDNKWFEPNDAWTWNYTAFTDKQGQDLLGFWRGIYKWYYDTDRPHVAPWEMLGFSKQPDWWTDTYGPAPYTSGNKNLWEDLELGHIRHGARSGIDEKFARPRLATIVPVDDTGQLRDPLQLFVNNFNSVDTSAAFAIGDQGPVESAWRRSSDYAFSVQVAFVLARPAQYLGAMFDVSRYRFDAELNQIVFTETRQRLIPDRISVPSNGLNNTDVVLTAGYANWVRDHLAYKGINGTLLMSEYLRKLAVRLSYKVAGFTDKRMLEVIAEQSSPGGSGRNIIIPDENYQIYLNKGLPTRRIVYSAIIVERTGNGFKLSGYDTQRPFFTIVPSEANSNAFTITEINSTVTIFRDFKRKKVNVPYGVTYQTVQEVADFITSYGRWLQASGFVFNDVDQDLGIAKDWNLSVREFLTWAQQGWRASSVIILSPVGSKITVISDQGIVDEITNKNIGNRLLDQNFALIRTGDFTVTRNDDVFTVAALYNKMLALADLTLIEYEHVLIFDNTTVFSDVIYQPELGNRQFRLRLIGYKSGNWTGQLSAPGYVFNDNKVAEWVPNNTYNIGSLVKFKDRFYVALEKVPESTNFDFLYWRPISQDQIKTGLLPNFSNQANSFRNFYDIDQVTRNETTDPYSNGLIGFRNRQFLQDLGIDTKAQLKFYQGYIKQKGTKNAVTNLVRGNFDRVASDIDYFEEWALRVGEYGATGSDQYVELKLNDQVFTEDPATVQLLNLDEVGDSGAVNFNPRQVYRYSEENFNKNVILARSDLTPRISDNITAGYPRLDDIDGTIYDIADYQNYSNLITQVGAGFKLWVAVDTNKSWNVYRATETDVLLTSIRRTSTTDLLLTFDKPHGTRPTELIVIKNFAEKEFDGFYRVKTVEDNLNVTVTGYKGLEVFQQITTVEGTGVYLRMLSVRYSQVNEIINFTPPHGWRNQDRAWIDNDTGNNIWGVFQKIDGWNFNQLLPLRQGEDRFREGYGFEVKLSIDNQIALAGTPKFSTGSLIGLRVINPGSNYDSPAVRISAPTGPVGQLAQFTALKDNGTLVLPNLIIQGSGYTFAPNVTLSDKHVTITTGETIDDDYLYLSSGDMDNIFIGDSVSGQGIPAGYTVTEEANVIPNAVKIGGPGPAALSSATTVTIGLGLKEFVTAVDADTTTIVAGQGVRILRFGSTTDYMEGYIISFADQLLTAMIEIESGSGTYSVWNITTQLSVRTGTAVTFERGSAGALVTRLAPTSIDYIEIINGGSGFILTPTVEIFGGGGTGATATAQISGGVITGITLTSVGSGFYEVPEVILLTNNTSPVEFRARLLPSSVGNLIITDKGTGYRQPTITIIPDSRDIAAGATATLSFYGNGGISSVTVVNRGRSYGANSNISIANSATGSGFVGTVSTFANGRVNAVTVVTPGSAYSTAAQANIFCIGGTGATGNVGRTIDGVAEFNASQVISYGQGYLEPPTVTVIDQTGSGSGAVVEAIMPTGQVKTFLRLNQNSYQIEETQLIKPFNDEAREFGFAVDIGTTLAAIGAPGTYNARGGVFITQTLGSQYISYQMLFAQDVAPGDRFGHSIAMTDDQQWIYVGSPGANKVYAYGKRSQIYSRVTIIPVIGQLIYPTNLGGIKTAQELKVIGSTGKIYEPNFDYAVDTLGTVYFADFARISNQTAIYITRQRLQTTVTPEIIRNLIRRTYPLESRPETIDQLLVYGATGRVFVPYKEYTVVGTNIVFLDDGFLSEPTITVNQREEFYQLLEIITPPDTVNADANFGWSVRTDSGGYRILVGAPDFDGIDEDNNVAPSSGRAYIFNRSYDVVLSVGTSRIYTFPTLRSVTSVRLNNVIVAENVDYTRSGNSIIFNTIPPNGSKINVDTNFFNIIQVIEAPSVINLGQFGRSVDISADNRTLIIGSPGYRDENYYNGQVYRYVNKGLFYGTVTTTKDFQQVSVFLGDTLKINDTLVTFSNIAPGSATNVTAVYSGISSTISLTSNVGLAIGDQVIGPDIVISENAKITGFDVIVPNVSANVILSIPVTVSAGDSLQFIRAGDNLDKIKRNFDSAGAVAVQANVTASGNLTLGISGEFALTTLDILPGTTGNVLAGIGLSVYGLTQVLQHPRYGVPEKFGTKVAVDDTGTVLIASEGGNTLKSSTFDNSTSLFDKDTTRFIDSLNASGAVYVYDYLGPPGETLENSGKLLYNQVLQNAQILTGDNFGASVDINRGWALVGADRSDIYSPESGAVHLFINDQDIKGWSRLRERGDEIDIDYINKGLIYDNETQLLTQDLDYFDPAKGKILGIADQDLDYKSSYDPATYNRGSRSSVTITEESFWGEVQEAQTWWDLSLARYINYEQGPLNYRSNRWGQLFPDSSIQVCEWVGSLVLPEDYAAEVGDGEAKYPDNSAYVETSFFDSQSGLIKTKYYYWVINKQGIDKTKTKRTNSVVTLESLIENPASQGIPYFAAIAANAFNIYNVKNFLNADRTTFRVEYSKVLGEIISHNEYELIQQGNGSSVIPVKLISKLIDSLSGENSTGSVVPDLRLNVADAYGISNLPRQSMIVNNLNAAKVFVTFVNNVLASKKVTSSRILARLLLKENVPASGVGFYDAVVQTIDQLQFIPESEIFVGFKVLVEQDSDFYGFWTIYEYQQFVGFRMIRIQSFDTTRWWSYQNWYASGYDEFLDINFVVPKYSDILTLDLVPGNTVKVINSGKGNYTIYLITEAGTIEEIVVENGTIALSTALYDPAQSLIGFDNSAFDQVGFSTTQAVELRNIFEALAYDIFVDDDQVEINNLFFTLLNYILSEQLTVDWAVKTSFINVLHKIRKLEQFSNYLKDNQDYYEQYINEVKPYRTQIREYLLDYEGTDFLNAGLSDFDFPSIYDKSFGNYRILNINNSNDLRLINASSRKDWYENYTYRVQDITLTFGGSGYTATPRIIITDGGGTGATARAVLGAFTNGTASVIQIILTSPGSGYTSTPTVLFEGGNGEGATAAIQLVQTSGTAITSTTLNKKVRSLFTKLKFDRVSYTSNIRTWKPYEIYHPGDLIVLDDVQATNFANYTERPLPKFAFVYRVLQTLTGRSTIDLNVFEDTTIVQKFSGSNLDNANDRLAAYLQPGSPDNARVYSSPNTVRLDFSAINNQIISVAKQWNSVRHSVFYLAQHGYQYAAVGDASLIALSRDGQNWVTNRITDTAINCRDVTVYRNYTWVVVANQGTIYSNDDGDTWIEEKIDQYRYDASNNDPEGKLQENTAQTLDMTGVASVQSTYSNYLLVAGNNGLILANPRNNSALKTDFDGWYNIKVQRQLRAENYLTMLSVDLGDLADVDGTAFDVEIQQVSGYFVESAFTNKRRMKAGFVITAGVNGSIYAITYNALDDYLQGFVQGYNYNNGKGGRLNYPWQSFDTPVSVKGNNNEFSGEQINKLAASDSRTNWIVAVGSSGTLLWNQFNIPIQTQLGRAELAPDTIGKTVVDYGLVMFNNFRRFDQDNFVAPLTRDALESYNIYDITWDGEKFVAVADKSIILWGYPAAQSTAYIEIGSIDPSMSIGTRRDGASWNAGTDVTSRVITVPAQDLDIGGVVVGMTCYADGLPDDSVVTLVVGGTSFHEITVQFATATVSAATEKALSFAYVFTGNIVANNTVVASNGVTNINLNVSANALVGTTRVYVDNYDDRVQSNWTLTGAGLPADARVKFVGKFANFQWQFAPGVTENPNLDYRTVSVNTTVIEISKPLLSTGNLYAGNIVTFSDPTGTIIQLPSTQDLPGNSVVLTFANIRALDVGFTIQSNSVLGIQDGTQVTKIVQYNIGGVESGLAKDIPDLIPGTGYTGSRVQGTLFTETIEDNLALDTIMQSEFTDELLGQRPEDIVIDGGKFIDTYNSHAPEELVPGQVIDSLQMNVFTANVVSGNIDYNNIIGFKIFTDYKLPSVYFRLTEANTTALSANLAFDDEEIFVSNVAKLPDSGSVWINSERIIYQDVDRINGKLLDIRRGSLRTAVAPVHEQGSLITDASISQQIGTDLIVPITQAVTVENGIVGGSNTSTYLSSEITTIKQGRIWLDLD